VAYAHVSPRAQALDRDFQFLYGPAWPVRTSEAFLTATYQYEVRGGLTLQPNVQYVRHPGGGATNPIGSMPGILLKDAIVLGMRTVVKF
jgi:porin